MKKIIAMTIFILFTAFAFVSEIAVAESLKDRIRESMEETKNQNEKREKCFRDIHEEFEKNGYDGDISFSMDQLFSSKEPLITVHVKDKKYKKEHGKEIKQIINEAIKSNNLGEVAVKVKTRPKGFGDISEKDKKLMEQNDKIFNITIKALEQKDYRFTSLGINAKSQNTIEIEIEGTKEYYNEVKNDIKKLVHDAIYSKEQVDYNIRVTRKSEPQIKDEKWQPIFQSIIDETDKEFDEVTGFAYSFHPAPLQIIIKTSLSKDNSEELVTKIENYVDAIIEIKRQELAIEEETYKVIIRGKGQEKLN